MSLSNLTSGGWIVFALALLYDLNLIIRVAAACTGTRVHRAVISTDMLLAVVFTTWLMWLVTPVSG